MTNPLETQTRNDSLDQKVSVILQEYSALREEAHSRLGFYFHIFEVYILITGAVFAYMMHTSNFDIVLLMPAVSLPLCYRLLWDQRMVRLIDDYAREVLSPRLESLIGTAPGKQPSSWLGWFDYFPSKIMNRPKGYKHSMAILFLIIPFGMAVAYSCWHIAGHSMQIQGVSRFQGVSGQVFFWLYLVISSFIFIRMLIRVYGKKF